MIAHHNNLRAQMLKKAHIGRYLLGMVDRFISCAELTASWVAARKVFRKFGPSLGRLIPRQLSVRVSSHLLQSSNEKLVKSSFESNTPSSFGCLDPGVHTFITASYKPPCILAMPR